MAKPTISVLLPVYNAGRYLNETLQSIWSQSYSDFEVLAVNDGSSDNSAEILDLQTDKRLRVWHRRNHGLASSLNFAAMMARGQYFARIDADDVCKPMRFERQLVFLRSQPNVAVVSGAVEYINNNGKVLGRSFPIVNPEKIAKRMRNAINCIAHPAVMMRASAFEESRGYCEAIGKDFEDTHLWNKILRRGYKISNVPSVLIAYRLVASSISGQSYARGAIGTAMVREIIKYDTPPDCLLEKYRNACSSGNRQADNGGDHVKRYKKNPDYILYKVMRRWRCLSGVSERLICTGKSLFA